ncbi:MAG: ice-binding family protein [Candidatus Zambryskibacteria bacterium]|nr:ice-binding family protein [Candidatus Zambryskibacteria bacterium]
MKIFSKLFSSTLILALSFGLTSTLLAATSVNLGSASNFAVLAGSTITNTGSSVINGDLGLSPGTSVTGFPPGAVNGSQQVNNGQALQAQNDLTTAYNAAAGQTGAITIAGDLGGQTLVPGVYSSASSIGLTGTLTLDGEGDGNAVFVFQAGSSLTTASGSNINFINGAQACNVYWQVGSSATLGTNSSFAGTVIALTSITLNTGADVRGRVLARNGAVTLDDNTITISECETVTTTAVVDETVDATTTPAVVATTTPAVTETTPFVGVVYQTPSVPNTGGHYSSFFGLLIFSLGIGFVTYGVFFVKGRRA